MVEQLKKFEGKYYHNWGITHGAVSLAQHKAMLRRKGYNVRTESETPGTTRIYIRKSTRKR